MAIDPIGNRPWLLLPGTLCTGDVFADVLDRLDVEPSKTRVIDLTHSHPKDYLDELTQVCTPDTIICGFSLGAIVAAHLADRIDAAHMMLFGLNPRADDPDKRDGRLTLAKDVHRDGGAQAIAARLPPLHGPDPSSGRARILAMAEASAQWIDAQTRLALDRPGALGSLGRSRCPVTCLTGTEDTQAPLDLAAEAATAAPNGRVVLLPGLGHYSLIEDPAICADAIARLWQETP